MRVMLGAITFYALVAAQAVAQTQTRPPARPNSDQRDIELAKCIDQVAQEIARRTNAPMWAARQDALRWCERNVR